MIKQLRKLGGTWTAERVGFGTFTYRGEWLNSSWELRSYAHLAPKYDGDDESFEVLWHIWRDGNPVGYASKHPVFQMHGFMPEYDERFTL